MPAGLWTFLICEHCKSKVGWPSHLSSELKSKIGKEAREVGLRAVHGTMAQMGVGLADAKHLLFHIPRAPGKCHRCDEVLSAEVSICGKCKSLNLDW